MKLCAAILVPILVNLLSSPGSAEATCERLASLSLPETTITVAQTVAAGKLTLSSPLPAPGPRGGLTYVSVQGSPRVLPRSRGHNAFEGLRDKV